MSVVKPDNSKKIMLAVLSLALTTLACVQPILLTPTPTVTHTATATQTATHVLYPTITRTPTATLFCVDCSDRIQPIATPKKKP